jgi:hypothetical protein
MTPHTPDTKPFEETHQTAEQRAERAEHRVEELEHRIQALESTPRSPSTQSTGQSALSASSESKGDDAQAIAALRLDSMMDHLLNALEAGQDIGHYGRLVFAMVAHHFLSETAISEWLTKEPEFTADQSRTLLLQVESRDYSPPRRERILEWQSQQEFPILPHPEDPDCGNLYRNLKFPQSVYEHIQDYQEEKVHAQDQFTQPDTTR